ncbi:MAG: SsrA-binding protein SmpB [Christensenellales bacterium]|jgi:SsrA-binding protein|nr:SsrA-binding protein SmpB [Clostridiales bacterium]
MIKVIATNKKAFHDYFIEEKYEAGIELVGSEVKSVRLGNVNLKDSFAIIKGGEIFLINAHIAPYNKGSYFNPQSKRDRRLLLHKQEINRLRGRVEKKGYTLVPTKIYFKDNLVKVELAVAKGKELHDKRQALKEKALNREIERSIKDY